MRWLAILAALIGASTAGCHDQEVAKLIEIKEAMCACRTAECAEKLMRQIPQRDARSTPRTQAVARQMLDCLAKLEIARPTTDPDDDDRPAPGAATSATSAKQ